MNDNRTIQQLVTQIATIASSEMDIDVSPKDVGWIVSVFLEALLPDDNPGARAWLQKIADEAASTPDEERPT